MHRIFPHIQSTPTGFTRCESHSPTMESIHRRSVMHWLRREFRPGSAISSIRSIFLHYLRNRLPTAYPDTRSVNMADNGLNAAYAPMLKQLSIQLSPFTGTRI